MKVANLPVSSQFSPAADQLHNKLFRRELQTRGIKTKITNTRNTNTRNNTRNTTRTENESKVNLIPVV